MESREGDGVRERISLSPFAVPSGVVLNTAPAGSYQFRFDYPGGEADLPGELLDGLYPAVYLTVARHTHKITGITVGEPVSADSVRRVAARVRAIADAQKQVGRRLSYKLICEVLKSIAPDLEHFGPPKQ
jgi:hypothetical protein